MSTGLFGYREPYDTRPGMSSKFCREVKNFSLGYSLNYKEIAFRAMRKGNRFMGLLRKGSIMDMDPQVACPRKSKA